MIAFPSGKFGVIYADSPLQYGNRREFRKDGGRCTFGYGASRSYSTMATDDICALPVADIAADDCALFLWATWPRLPDVIKIIEAWGFRYVTAAFDWVKIYPESLIEFKSVGNYTMSNSEPCLLGIKGHPQRRNKDVAQIFLDWQTETILAPHPRQNGKIIHSRKPAIFRERIDRLYDGPKIELFGRSSAEGWTVWGNEADKFDKKPREREQMYIAWE